MESDAETQHKPVDKGKRRVIEPDEQTPLLAGSSSSSSSTTAARLPSIPIRPLWNKLLCVFLISLSLSIVVMFLLIVLAVSYASHAASASPQEMLDTSLVFRGPSQVDVMNVTNDGGLHILIGGRMGVDAGSLLKVHKSPEEDGLLSVIWKGLGRWGIRRIDRISLRLQGLTISPHYNASITLACVQTHPLELPLAANPPHDDTWLSDLTIPLTVLPTPNASDLRSFAKDVWAAGSVSIRVHIDRLILQGGGLSEHGWRTLIHRTMSNISIQNQFLIPPLPGTPHPPFPPISQLVTLLSFNLTAAQETIALRARATVIDPIPESIHLTAPTLPFVISLPSPEESATPVASVVTQPFTFTHPNITLDIEGRVLPLVRGCSPILSSFLSRYLSAEDNSIVISSPLYPAVQLDAIFPAPNPRPRILRNVTIKDMRIKAHGTTFLASGTVHARVVLPQSMKIDLDIFRVFPDVLVFDGDVPGDDDFVSLDAPPSHDLPNPVPEGAFGHIRPDDWLDSISEPIPSDEDEGSVFSVTADIADVPLKVLPGRQKEFSNFVGKVVFRSDGAIAGIMGWTSVDVNVPGLPMDGAGSVELHRLPFQGRVRIRRNTF